MNSRVLTPPKLEVYISHATRTLDLIKASALVAGNKVAQRRVLTLWNILQYDNLFATEWVFRGRTVPFLSL